MKIFVRERQKVGSGVKEPRFRIVAIIRAPGEQDLKIEAVHFRKIELEQIAAEIKAGIVYLEPMPEEEQGTKKG
ncbi:MAG: hypothetical protein LUQ40_04625 [Methanomicrobiales archaeon]|nr:hypothetical protein [Methanomicrobiales archaeon]